MTLVSILPEVNEDDYLPVEGAYTVTDDLVEFDLITNEAIEEPRIFSAYTSGRPGSWHDIPLIYSAEAYYGEALSTGDLQIEVNFSGSNSTDLLIGSDWSYLRGREKQSQYKNVITVYGDTVDGDRIDGKRW